MSLPPSRHFTADHQYTQTRREHRDSDATLVDHRSTRLPEPVYGANAVRPAHGHPRNPYRDYRQSRHFEQSPRVSTRNSGQYSNSSQPRRASCLKQSRQSYPSKDYDNVSLPHKSSAQQRRNVHFDDEGDSYGLVNDDDDHEDLYTPFSSRHRRDSSSDYSGKRYSGLPQPVTAPQGPASGGPLGYLIIPPKEKKTSLFQRLMKSLAAAAADPELLAVGCRPGEPTPQHILDKEAEEDAIEEARQAEVQRQKEENVRQSKLRRLNAYNARKAERQAHQQQATSVSEYNSRLAEAYTQDRLRDYDPARNSKRIFPQSRS